MKQQTWRQSLSRILYGQVKTIDKRYASLVRAHGASRKKAVDFILSIGSRSYHGRTHAVVWRNKLYSVNLDHDTLYKNSEGDDLRRQCATDGERGALYNLFRYVHADSQGVDLFELGTEDAWRMFTEQNSSAADTFWGAPAGADFSLEGRSGGWLSLNACEGFNLLRDPDEIRDILLERDSRGCYCVSHDTVVTILLYVIQTQADWFTESASVDREVEHHAAFFVWSTVQDLWGDFLRDYRGKANSLRADSVSYALADSGAADAMEAFSKLRIALGIHS